MIEKDLLHNKYSLVKGAARRARQIYLGAPMLGASSSTKVCRVAQDEIRVGKVTYIVSPKQVPPAPL